MVNQKPIQVHDTTHELFRLLKLKFQVKVEKQLSDNDFTIKLIHSFASKEKIKID